ncbi:MAG: hypothetical protein LC647_17680, partial [Beggiatoa sp.]|nr:hypothetical protein [Beggiatoa sp.]
GKRSSEAQSRASGPGNRGPEGRFHGLEGDMNGPVAGIRPSEARVRHRVGGQRTSLGGPPALKILATREDPDGLQCMAARLQFPVAPRG